jgi:hypothetical protein
MSQTRFHQTLWVIEAVLGALPATIYALFWLGWSVWITVVRRSDVLRDPRLLLDLFFPYIAVAIATILGLLSLWTGVLLAPSELGQRPRLRLILILLFCAGMLVDVPFLVLFGVSTLRNFAVEQTLMIWVLLGPLVVGIHCFYRVQRYNRDLAQPRKAGAGSGFLT